ncbi:ankyrin repeat protein, putative [Trichomonas vaginalis G3]|uniref:Ankyrin repeat protein, putative n=1 Tax=Trichomonas vaginalis (strain ATCC PRA-98 / G3) TaxID=412133 RepID=A2GMJ5_TRIV3|nr:spectrin binding [Trichomonas vaginalis G3]EAX81622.1 ankyrin repeat protein, putative [Trichomonas vaginalis G3]KAI5512993.1 spectrin binding [Trichomonas vaginalis G3]|eukprot:XP_001294552.1 ankyrin repeat protein [Trichomonas vaginalis G3]
MGLLIFFYLISNFHIEITDDTLEYSYIGNNSDIINECLKHQRTDNICLNNAVSAHNNNRIEELLKNPSMRISCLNYHVVIKSLNLYAVFFLAKLDLFEIIPWCPAFPQTLEILKENAYHVNLHAYGDTGLTALHYSIIYDNIDYCKVLLDIPWASIDSKDNEGRSSLYFAVEMNNYPIAKFLIDKGGNVNSQNKKGKSVLRVAIDNNNEEMVKLLLSKGANINAIDSSGETALHEAVRLKNTEMIEYLLSHGANIEAIGKGGKTAFYYAAENNNLEMVKFLFSHGANINTCARNYETQLLIAAMRNHQDIIKFLIDHGADINAIILYTKKRDLTLCQISVKVTFTCQKNRMSLSN